MNNLSNQTITILLLFNQFLNRLKESWLFQCRILLKAIGKPNDKDNAHESQFDNINKLYTVILKNIKLFIN